MCLLLVQFLLHCSYSFFFFNDTATTEIYTLSLHDALPIWSMVSKSANHMPAIAQMNTGFILTGFPSMGAWVVYALGTENRSEEHTSELQSQSNLVCRLLLEKKKKNTIDVAQDTWC